MPRRSKKKENGGDGQESEDGGVARGLCVHQKRFHGGGGKNTVGEKDRGNKI